MYSLEKRWQGTTLPEANYKTLERLVHEYQRLGLFNYSSDMDLFVFFRFYTDNDVLKWANRTLKAFWQNNTNDLFEAVDEIAFEVSRNWQIARSATRLKNGQQLLYTESEVDKVALILGIYHVLETREVRSSELRVS